MLFFILDGVSWDKTDRAVIFQDSGMDFFDARKTCLAQGSIQLVVGEPRIRHDVLENLSVVNEYLGPAFDNGFQLLAAKGHYPHYAINANQSGGRDKPADQRVVASVH